MEILVLERNETTRKNILKYFRNQKNMVGYP